MKIIIFAVLVLCAEVISSAADTPTLKADAKPEVERQLVKVEQEWNEAYKCHNKTALTSLCADDFQFTDDSGKTGDKTRYLEDAARARIAAYTLSSLTARAYGDTGVVVGQWTGTVAEDNGNAELAFRFTDTFVRREGRWWAVASQMTRLPADPH